jgi:putative long chain acyl-CoA synthase
VRLTHLITEPVGRFSAATQNAIEIARFGGLQTDDARSPYRVELETPTLRLRHYFSEDATGAPLLLVPPLMLDADVYDVGGDSGVGPVHAGGLDPWVVDFGRPDQVPGGCDRRVEDHVLAVDSAIETVARITGRPVHVAGYSQGGIFAYQATALRGGRDVASLIGFGSAVDMRAGGPFGASPEAMARLAALLSEGPIAGLTVPAWVSRTAFQVIDPAKTARQRLDFVRRLHDREALLARERQRRFLDTDGYVAWPGPAVADLMRDLVLHNRMLRGGLVIDGRAVTLVEIECPVLAVVGSADAFAPPATVRGIGRAAPSASVYELEVPTGHFGLVVGKTAASVVWPTVCEWVRWQQGDCPTPNTISRLEDRAPTPEQAKQATTLRASPRVFAQLGFTASRSAVRGIARTAREINEIASEARTTLQRIARLQSLQPDTAISLASLLEEHAARAPDSVCFLYDDRAHTCAAAKARVDSVTAGLLSLGVRQGERVGVLMGTRPSALVAIAALNRMGAVAVLLRPDGDPVREARLAEASYVIADPEHIEQALTLGIDVFALGGGAAPRQLHPHVIDMERIDPDAVIPPVWFTPNPGLGSDLAFVVFSGVGEQTRAVSITNARWVLSAVGTASAGALGRGDTLYSAAPLHHSSTLLMTLGGAIASGARFALSRGYDPDTFWSDVRRYGVTAASYTWSMLHDVVESPPHPAERHHPLRLLLGSGMPASLWPRAAARFAPARVLEFYASAQGEAVLVNLSGTKPGSVGRPLPGAAPVEIVAWDLEVNQLLVDENGLARICEPDEVGMLVSKAPSSSPRRADEVRNVLSPGDTWIVTGDLFRRDHDGDYWLVSPVSALVRTTRGVVAPSPARAALEALAEIDLAEAYGLEDERGAQRLVSAVTLLPGARLNAKSVAAALRCLPAYERPDVVQVLEQLPLSSTYRPDVRALQALGLSGTVVYQRARRPAGRAHFATSAAPTR